LEEEIPFKENTMIRSFILITSLFILSLNGGFSQSDTIPFRLTDANNIALPALLNAQDSVLLMLHTAAQGITLIEEHNAQSVTFTGQDSVTSWGGQQDARYSLSNSLQIGQSHWDSLIIWENKHSGPGTVGKFGLDFFEGKVVEIHFDRKELIIHDSLPKLDSSYQGFELRTEHGSFFITGESKIGEKAFPNQFLIHTGYGGSILLDDAFAAKHQLDQVLPITDEQILKDAYGNEIKVLKAELPIFQVGEYEVAQTTVGFFPGAIGRQRMSVLGGEMLKKFNCVFDLQKNQLHLQRSEYF